MERVTNDPRARQAAKHGDLMGAHQSNPGQNTGFDWRTYLLGLEALVRPLKEQLDALKEG